MRLKYIWASMNFVRSIPAGLAYITSRQKSLIEEDVDRWIKHQILDDMLPKSYFKRLNWLLVYSQEFRNLFYNRISNILVVKAIGLFYPRLNTLYISTKTNKIGSGLFISHGFSTIIVAKSIGKNCWINQQVTIGYNDWLKNPPTIGNTVRIGAGAIVIGDIRIGDNSFIGAGSVVTKDVPPNCVVVGNPAYILKRDGVTVKEPL